MSEKIKARGVQIAGIIGKQEIGQDYKKMFDLLFEHSEMIKIQNICNKDEKMEIFRNDLEIMKPLIEDRYISVNKLVSMYRLKHNDDINNMFVEKYGEVWKQENITSQRKGCGEDKTEEHYSGFKKLLNNWVNLKDILDNMSINRSTLKIAIDKVEGPGSYKRYVDGICREISFYNYYKDKFGIILYMMSKDEDNTDICKKIKMGGGNRVGLRNIIRSRKFREYIKEHPEITFNREKYFGLTHKEKLRKLNNGLSDETKKSIESGKLRVYKLIKTYKLDRKYIKKALIKKFGKNWYFEFVSNWHSANKGKQEIFEEKGLLDQKKIRLPILPRSGIVNPILVEIKEIFGGHIKQLQGQNEEGVDCKKSLLTCCIQLSKKGLYLEDIRYLVGDDLYVLLDEKNIDEINVNLNGK